MSSAAVATKWLAYEDACERVGVTRSTADKWRKTGRCFPTKKLPNGSIRVREDLLEMWLEELPEAS